jgi:methylated-DNA-[protein]-cysteine S-methyltransferase
MTEFTRRDTSIGTLLLVAAGDSLSGIYFTAERHCPMVHDWREVPHHALLMHAAGELDQYFNGERTEFSVSLAPTGTAFQRDVWGAIAAVPYGSAISYGELAQRIGRPGSSRAVGRATGRNPISIIVPCHRIIGARGQMTGYAGGLARKTTLLALEASRDSAVG